MSDPAKYRTKEEVEDYKSQDPVEQVRKTILDNKIATKEQLSELDAKIKVLVNGSVKFAEESKFPDPTEAMNDVYVQKDYPFVTG